MIPGGRGFLLLALLGQFIICLWARSALPAAVSDDDYARVVIAQEFAARPRLDPSGTSWLPLPFFLSGGAMWLFGGSLEVARLTAILLSVLAAGLLYGSSRLLGASPPVATLAALVAAALPTSAQLSIATVPEYPTAALLTFAICAASRRAPVPRRWAELLRWPTFWACAAAAAATACRYEAWPVALGLSLLVSVRALSRAPSPDQASPDQGRSVARTALGLSCSALSSGFIVLWLLHGIFRKGDALFFVHRVTNYKHAWGGADPASWAEVLGGYPKLLLVQEPGAVALLLLGSVAAYLGERPDRPVRRGVLVPLGLLPALLLASLVLGDLRGGAPTHHPGRALLSLWLLLALTGVCLLALGLLKISGRSRRLGLAAVVLSAVWGANRIALRTEGAAERSSEERLGRTIRSASTSAPVVLATPDYGYLAIQAAAGRPSRFFVVDRHDPRDSPTTEDPVRQTLRLVKQTEATLLVAPSDWAPPGFTPLLATPELKLWGVPPPGGSAP